MADPSYCEPADLYAYGLARGALTNVGRLAGSVSVASGAIELDGHGFALNDALSMRAEGGGAMPSPLVVGTTYTAIPVDGSHFRVAAQAGGVAIALTTAGSRLVVIAPLPIAFAIAWASRILDDMLPAAVVPLASPYPEVVKMTAAELAIWKLATFTGNASGSITQMIDFAQKRIARWASGVPIRGTNAPAPAGLAVNAAVARSDSRGWLRYGGIR